MLERKLGGIERQFNQQNSLGCINFCSVLFIEGDWNGEHLGPCLVRLAQIYPRLLCRIVADPYPRFEALPSSSLLSSRILPRQHDEQWRGLAELEIQRDYSQTQGLAAIHVLVGAGKSEILLSMHHSLGDGLSALAIMRSLWQLSVDPTLSVRPALLGPALEERLPADYLGWKGLRHGLRYILSMLAKTPIDPFRLGASNNCITRHSRSCGWVLDPASNAFLCSYFKSHGANLMSGVCAASLLAIAQMQHLETNVWMSLNTPANLRLRLREKVESDELGLFMSGMLTWHRLGTRTDLMELARSIHKRLNQSLENGDPLSLCLLGAGPKKPKVPSDGRFFNRFRPCLNLSNQGIIPMFPQSKGAHAVGYRSLVGLWPHDSLALVMQSFEGRLLIDVMVSMEKLSLEWAQAFMEKQRSLLMELLPPASGRPPRE